MNASKILLFTTLAASTTQAALVKVLQVNLGNNGSSPTITNEPGFTNWTVGDRSTDGTYTNTINSIGLTVTTTVSESNQLRALNRSSTYGGTLGNLTDSWWGVRSNASGDDGGQFVFAIDGADLGAGSFEWTSWHTDESNQSGTMLIEFSIDGGSNYSTAFSDFDIVDNVVDGTTGAPNPANFSFVSNGGDDILVRFTYTGATGSADNFAVVNGFQIDAVVPEPSSTALLGLGGLALMLRRKRG